jgi:predicted nucleic acid-binding Zn ribbon protein
MRRRGEEPVELGVALNSLAGRLKKVDLRVIDEVRALWPSIVDPVIAEHCRPEFVKDGELLVSVPSGAFAERVMSQSKSILEGCAALGRRAPTSLRTVLER